MESSTQISNILLLKYAQYIALLKEQISIFSNSENVIEIVISIPMQTGKNWVLWTQIWKLYFPN